VESAGVKRLVLALACAAACGGGAATPTPQTQPTLPPTRPSSDSAQSAVIPPMLGTLRQDDISIVLQPEGVRVTAIPLDESVIRTLAPDSYRTLHGTYESRRQQIVQRGQVRGIREPKVWYVGFYGLAPNARFVPTDMTVTSGGREYRPFDVIPITSGFGTQRLQPRESQYGLLLFDEGVDANQPLVVTMGSGRNFDWSNDPATGSILTKIEAERANIRARRTNP
jgi:hypothetical protein